MPSKTSKMRNKLKASEEETILFQKFMIEEMGLWKLEDGQLFVEYGPYVSTSYIKERFLAYKNKLKPKKQRPTTPSVNMNIRRTFS